MRDIGKNIKSLREEKKLSQVQLAEKLFVTRQTISNYEIGRSCPDLEMLTRIADVLDVDISMIIYGVQPSSERYIERKKLVIAFLVTLHIRLTILLGSITAVMQLQKQKIFRLNWNRFMRWKMILRT